MRAVGVRVPCHLSLLGYQTQVLLVLLDHIDCRIPHCSCLATTSHMLLVQAQEGEQDMEYRYLSELIDLQAHQHYAFPSPDDSG